MAFPNLPNAPITEAVIDLRVRLAPNFDIQRLQGMREKTPDYPTHGVKRNFMLSAQFDKDKIVNQTAKEAGLAAYLSTSTDGKQIYQCRPDGFSFHRLAPYTCWGDMYSEAMRLWKIYIQVAEPLEVLRMGVRNINQIQVPFPISRLAEHFIEPPRLSSRFNLDEEGFMIMHTVSKPGTRMKANIISASKIEAGRDAFQVVLDIDAFEQGNFSPEPDTFRSHFEALREEKNFIFFNSMTPSAIETFKLPNV